MKKLKITVFVSYTYPYIGSGIGNVALKQCEMLANLGHDVTIISSNYPKTNKEFTKDKVKHIKLSAIFLLEKIQVPVPLYIFNLKVLKLILQSNIIHVHDSVYPSSLLAVLFGRLFKKNVVLTQHISQIEYQSKLINNIQEIAYITIGRISLALSKKIIFINGHVKNQFKVNKSKSIVILNGVDTEMFHPVNEETKKELRKKYNLPINKKIILFVGRFVSKKGYNLLLKLEEPNLITILIGGHKQSKINNNILILNKKPQNELKEFYQLSDMFILPSYGEGFPLSIQEAMASGLPIMTTKNLGYSKLLPINCVKYIKPDPFMIKKAIKSLIFNKQELKKMGHTSRKWTIEKYSWNKNIDELLKIYEDLKA